MSYYLETALLLTIMGAPLVAGLSRFKWLDTASRLIIVLLVVCFLTEAAATYLAISHGNNLPVYNISGFIQLSLICCYLEISTEGLMRNYHIGIAVAFATILYGILNMVYLQSWDTINTNFQAIAQTSIVVLGIAQLFKLSLSNMGQRIWNNSHFCFGTIITCYACCQLFYLLSYPSFSILLKGHTRWLDQVLLITNVLYSLCLVVIFFRYPKMNRNNGNQ
jgi:hypothetical protein